MSKDIFYFIPKNKQNDAVNGGNNKSFINILIKRSWIALLLATCFQILFFQDRKNIIALVYILFAWIFISKLILKKNIIFNFPLSSFLIIGFSLTQFYFPLIFTSIEKKPVVYNLEVSSQVFFHSMISLIVLILSHWIYRSCIKKRRLSVRSTLLTNLGIFKPPSNLQIWLMGILGLAATYYAYIYSPTIGWSVTGLPVDKLIQALTPFSYAPFFIPFGAMYGAKKKMTKKEIAFLVIFTLVLIILSIGRNSRSGFMIGFSSLGFAYFLGLMLGTFNKKIFTLKNLILLFFAFWAGTGPIADLGTAMVNVRDSRRDISPEDLIIKTIHAYSDKNAIKKRRLEDNNSQADWDERYLNNILTTRFCNLKFNDASLIIANKIGNQNPAMLTFSFDYLWATLPQPILTALHVNVDKKALKGISFGDYLYYLSGHYDDSLGGFRTGNFSATGLTTFGWWYLMLLGIGIIPVYYLFDLFSTKLDYNSGKGFNVTKVHISFCGLLALDMVFRFLPSESIISIGVFLIRDWIQLTILYLIVFNLTNILYKVFNNLSSNLNRRVIRS